MNGSQKCSKGKMGHSDSKGLGLATSTALSHLILATWSTYSKPSSLSTLREDTSGTQLETYWEMVYSMQTMRPGRSKGKQQALNFIQPSSDN